MSLRPGIGAIALLLAGCAGSTIRTPMLQNHSGQCWRAIPAADFTINGESPVMETTAFRHAVLSCNARFEPGAKVNIQLRVRSGGAWSGWFTMLRFENGRYQSVKSAGDAIAKPEIDTLTLNLQKTADAFQVRYNGISSPPDSVGVTWYGDSAQRARAGDARSRAWGLELPVPRRSQSVEDPRIASRICSPTSTAMALEYFGIRMSTAEFAARVHDSSSDLYGNWSVNASTAGTLLGEAFAIHAPDFTEIENEILQNRPVVLSHAWKEGELAGSPIPKTSGHLITIIGFTSTGDLIANDPAAPPASVRRIYKRNEIFKTWQENASGILYIFRPRTGL